MRVKQPLHGLERAMGHVIFHITFLVCSFLVSDFDIDSQIEKQNKENPNVVNLYVVMKYLRFMHGFLFVSVYIRALLKNPDWKILSRILRVIEIFVFYFVFLFLQFQLCKFDPTKQDLTQSKDKAVLMFFFTMEILSFYTQVLTMVVFLLYIIGRGVCGRKNYEANKDRYKFDALEYYKADVTWLSFQTIPFIQLAVSFCGLLSEDNFYRDLMVHPLNYFQMVNIIYQIIALNPYQNQKKEVTVFSWKAWAPIFVMFAIQIGMHVSEGANEFSIPFLLLLFDILIVTQQLLMYRREQEDSKDPEGESWIQLKVFSVLVAQKDITYKAIGRKSQVENFIDEPLVFSNDIYNLAYAALIHPDSFKDYCNTPGHIPKVTMLNYERDALFSGAICIAFSQVTYLYILSSVINSLTINSTNNFTIMIPRLLSAMMMHLVVMPDARQGLRLMKFAFKHPSFFQPIQDQREDDNINEGATENDDGDNISKATQKIEYSPDKIASPRVFSAFLLGFFQFMITMVASLQIIILLFNEQSVLGVMIKFVAFSSVTKFDDFFAANMTENPIKACVGKKILFQFQRKMSEVHPEDAHLLKQIKTGKGVNESLINFEDAKVRNVMGTTYVMNPRNKSCFLFLLFTVFKLCRTYFVILAYYFTPVTALFLNLWYNFDLIPKANK